MKNYFTYQPAKPVKSEQEVTNLSKTIEENKQFQQK